MTNHQVEGTATYKPATYTWEEVARMANDLLTEGTATITAVDGTIRKVEVAK